MIRIRGLKKWFKTRHGQVEALRGIDLDVREREFFVLLGPSGCGKTTTLRCVAGLERADAGEIDLGGAVVSSPNQGIYVTTEKRDIGMVFQSYAIWPHMNVFQNVAFPLIRGRRRVAKSQVAEKVRQALKLVQLDHLVDRPATELSGGQQQRVAMAQLKKITHSIGVTTLYVTHDQAEALSLGDRVCVMNEGEILQTGSPHEVYSSPNSLFVAQFVGEMNFIHGRVSAAGEVESPLGKFSCAVPRGCEAGREVTLAIRPEHLVLRPETARSSEGVAAKVLIKNYLGDAALLEVEACGVSLRVKLSGDAGFAVGEKVVLVLPQDRWRVFS
ncbi:MAG: ABC transporter ATP-binding protein [Deltaproteobacteria bacterium]|nr:ABC transporter ATP-binding protein [Deltaproteobacteria bacterium]